MTTQGIIKQGVYYDSVTLMTVTQRINALEGIVDSSVVMGTRENKAILESAGLFVSDFADASDTDLLISVQAENSTFAQNAMARLEMILKDISSSEGSHRRDTARSIHDAVERLEGSNLSLISIAGRYAVAEVRKALDLGLHVMLFSDNVPIEDEKRLKEEARDRGLLLMGPDCGTAIINGVPLAFANAVQRGNIGIVAASGTGLQEVSCIISNRGAGISQALGTGGRDVKKEIGGIMFIEAMKALFEDERTQCIVLISKPPDDEVLSLIAKEISRTDKPVVAMFIGANSEKVGQAGALPAHSLSEAALLAVQLSLGKPVEDVRAMLKSIHDEVGSLAKKLSPGVKGRYVRGLFSGGTLCHEAQLILKEHIGHVYSNVPLDPDYLLSASGEGSFHSLIDMGDDAFTAGRPHPMIDFSQRCKRIQEEAKNPETVIVLFDLVLGYGAHVSPLDEILPAVTAARRHSPDLLFICSVTGTDDDPQNRQAVTESLRESGVIVMMSNYSAALLTGHIIKNITS
ncbi:MAG: acyl-CoA synthetase FdrA [Bacteroidia bacterium]|nr:MAG: acyl-CoA synthetase FdrA [Bacteroidia bacterium]